MLEQPFDEGDTKYGTALVGCGADEDVGSNPARRLERADARLPLDSAGAPIGAHADDTLRRERDGEQRRARELALVQHDGARGRTRDSRKRRRERCGVEGRSWRVRLGQQL